MFLKLDSTCKLLACIVLASACATTKPAQPQGQAQEPIPVAPDSVVWRGDEDLAPILTRANITPAILQAAERVEMRLGPAEFADRLADVSEDTTAPWMIRVNALRYLANRGAIEQFPVFAEALHAREEVIRVSAVTFMREYMAVRPSAATELLVAALNDPSMRVQSAALQLLGDRDLDALRTYLNRTTHTEMRVVALDVVRAADERGAPLLEKDSSGTLERTTSNATVLTFRPTVRWQQWDAAAGDLIITLPKFKPLVVASNVEVVGRVVPAFFSADFKTLVYEVNREIHTRDLVAGADKKLVDGIAPRILPFSNDIIYMTEVRGKRIESPNSVGMKFAVMRIPLTGGTPVTLGQVNSIALNNIKGNYANVRWTRVREDDGNFVLIGDNIDFKLPSPFSGK